VRVDKMLDTSVAPGGADTPEGRSVRATHSAWHGPCLSHGFALAADGD
jgi:hypothetical protein